MGIFHSLSLFLCKAVTGDIWQSLLGFVHVWPVFVFKKNYLGNVLPTSHDLLIQDKIFWKSVGSSRIKAAQQREGAVIITSSVVLLSP